MNEGPRRFRIDRDRLPALYPTHLHCPEFWAALGRTVATFGFLEEVLAKAIFALTGTREIPEEELTAAFEKWIPTLERALSDPLGGLIIAFEKALKGHPEAIISNPDELIKDLKAAADLRNVLCHGSWRQPDADGRSIPHFVSRKKEVFKAPIDLVYLQRVQAHATELICSVIETVTGMGWQFPGSRGPGRSVMPSD